VILVLVSIFAYVLAHNSENANQMHLSIHSKPPGFNVNMLSIPLEERQEKTLSNYFLGFKIVLLSLLLKVIP
jgi:peptide/nickel transport system permease protein